MEWTSLLDGKVKLAQPKTGFRAGMDSVVLAAAVPARESQHILEMGCGVGSVSLCLSCRISNLSIIGVEFQKIYADIAIENVKANDSPNITILHQNIADLGGEYDCRFDHVVFNPPFLEEGSYLGSPDESRAPAMGEMEGALQFKDWIAIANRVLKPKAMLTFIHRADYLQNIMKHMDHRFGQIEIIPIYSKENEPAKRIIIRAKKGSRSPSILHPGVFLYDIAISNAILREGHSIL